MEKNLDFFSYDLPNKLEYNFLNKPSQPYVMILNDYFYCENYYLFFI